MSFNLKVKSTNTDSSYIDFSLFLQLQVFKMSVCLGSSSLNNAQLFSLESVVITVSSLDLFAIFSRLRLYHHSQDWSLWYMVRIKLYTQFFVKQIKPFTQINLNFIIFIKIITLINSHRSFLVFNVNMRISLVINSHRFINFIIFRKYINIINFIKIINTHEYIKINLHILHSQQVNICSWSHFIKHRHTLHHFGTRAFNCMRFINFINNIFIFIKLTP